MVFQRAEGSIISRWYYVPSDEEVDATTWVAIDAAKGRIRAKREKQNIEANWK